tara:strand:+ start:469 stop:798 length:330 start_codon:yes stop_codon:yes gene_type:complete
MDPIQKSLRKKLLERNKSKEARSAEVLNVDVDGTHHDEESTLIMHDINTLNKQVRYLSSLNSDLIEFLHSLVKELEHNNDIDLGDARRDFTVLLNRSGRRKFYQQTKRL